MSRGISLHIGVNRVAPEHYAGWSGPLNACEYDANAMEALATEQGFTPTKLLTTDATRDAVLAGIRHAADKLTSKDVFFLTYSGHGGQIIDKNEDEIDGFDETWCLFDGELIDDELYREWSRFEEGTRIVVLSDSCHSGTVAKAAVPPPRGAKVMPIDLVRTVHEQNSSLYDPILAQPAVPLEEIRARLVLISGCQDNQYSMDGPYNGAFTWALLRAWNDGTFKGNYRTLHSAVQAALPETQSPNLFSLGDAASLLSQRAFTI